MKEQKYTLTVTESQLQLIAQCVEDCHRFAAGQMELSNTTSLVHGENLHQIRFGLRELQPFMTGGEEYSWNGYECPDESQRKFIAQTYCIYREIIHRLTVDDGNKEWSVYAQPTLTCDESGPLPKIEKTKEDTK